MFCLDFVFQVLPVHTTLRKESNTMSLSVGFSSLSGLPHHEGLVLSAQSLAPLTQGESQAQGRPLLQRQINRVKQRSQQEARQTTST